MSDEPDEELLARIAALERRVAELEAAQALLLESATANLEFMQATNRRLDELEARKRP